MTSNQDSNTPEPKKNNSQKEGQPDCFADINQVFPMGSDGLRHITDSCFKCPSKTDCLRSAMDKKQGLNVRSEMVDRAYHSGVMGFFERWSKRKALSRKMNS